jgi:hypothetical protein
MQLILATFLTFLVFMKFVGGHLAYTRDTDLIYRASGRAVLAFSSVVIEGFARWRKTAIMDAVVTVSSALRGDHPQKLFGRPVADTIGAGVAFTATLFALLIVLFFFR